MVEMYSAILTAFQDKGTSQSKPNSQGSSTIFIYKTLIIPSFLDSCFISSTVFEDKRVMLCLDLKICAKDKNFSSIWAYTTIMLPRVRNHHGGKCNLLKIGMLVWGKLIQKLRQKGVYKESFSRHVAWIGGKLIQFMHTIMVPVQVKTMKIQAGIQVSRPRELIKQEYKFSRQENSEEHLTMEVAWKDFISVVFVT
ncbi:hypothetical protein Tco_1243842 [Tanacetum coccineum]